MGPGSHCERPRDFDFTGEIVRYFDHELKGVDNGFADQPRVTRWVDGAGDAGRYVRGEAWPGEDSDTLVLYLDGGSRLAARPGAAGSDAFAVDYDVADDAYFAFWPSPLDEHGLVWDTAPLTAPMDLLGFPVAHVTIAADREDADVFVYLEAVDPAGEAEVVSFGRLKASQRAISPAPWDNLGLPWHSGRSADARPLVPGQSAELVVPMMATSYHVPAGSRLRFVVTGADPRQRNLADLRQDPAPVITVAHVWEYGSRIELPISRGEGQ